MDLAFRWGAQGADLVLEGDDLKDDPGLASEILVSIFSDARAERQSGDPELQDLRGWWAETPPDRFGSLLWTLERAKVTDQTLERARSSVAASLLWMRQAGIAQEIKVTALRTGRERIEVTVVITPGPSPSWSSLWQATTDFRFESGAVFLIFAPG